MWPLPTLSARGWLATGIAALALALVAAIWVQTLRLTHARTERDLARQALANYRTQAAMTALAEARKGERINEEISREFAKSQARAEANAWRNARARYGAGAVVCRPGPLGLRLDLSGAGTGGGQADRAESDGDLPEPERLVVDRAFVRGCAADADFVENAWHEWRERHELKTED